MIIVFFKLALIGIIINFLLLALDCEDFDKKNKNK